MSPSVDPGRMVHQVTAQRADRTRGTAGGWTPGWYDLAVRPAAIQQLGGRELMHARQSQSQATHRVVMRYEPDLLLTPKDRLVWLDRGQRERVLNILAVDGDDGEELRLTCEEVTP